MLFHQLNAHPATNSNILIYWHFSSTNAICPFRHSFKYLFHTRKLPIHSVSENVQIIHKGLEHTPTPTLHNKYGECSDICLNDFVLRLFVRVGENFWSPEFGHFPCFLSILTNRFVLFLLGPRLRIVCRSRKPRDKPEMTKKKFHFRFWSAELAKAFYGRKVHSQQSRPVQRITKRAWSENSKLENFERKQENKKDVKWNERRRKKKTNVFLVRSLRNCTLVVGRVRFSS